MLPHSGIPLDVNVVRVIMQTSLFDLSPLLQIMLLGMVVSLVPLLWLFMRTKGQSAAGRWKALTLITLFLTFDLVLFGAFTRLSDSGLGCPDWPGCYGSASPVGARVHIEAAQTALPSGPVTHGKAWIEMLHRYLASGVGVLMTILAVSAWYLRNQPNSKNVIHPWWPTMAWVWVCIQGAFGALTVTMKLFPAIVTLHLLGGYILLAFLTVQAVMQEGLMSAQQNVHYPKRLSILIGVALVFLIIQAASGAWVSTQYAVLACTEFPRCQNSWWPTMDFAQAFDLWHPLGVDSKGVPISFQALTAIHYTHRLLAMVTLLVLGCLSCYLIKKVQALRRQAMMLAGLLLLQLATGLSNVVLGWPLAAAILHTGGAGAMVVVLVWMLTISYTASQKP